MATGDVQSGTIGIDQSAVGLQAGAADSSEEEEPLNREERTGRASLPKVDFGGILQRLTEGTAKLTPNDPCPRDPQWLLMDYLGGL